ncbi:PREDICTED: glutathione S-transferase T3-like [Nicotiana attenuata]|uniref:glutathione S-transferase T3-like n=1 Tax=Nicotiana attenuata TaxID=49451 RepID=UPI0009055F36|nr:PREDICTED: glutathione S-transferase T3-like [Nicotiana attenuata]
MSGRPAGYTANEDKLLCQVYLDVSQDPVTGIYQSKDNFWNRVVAAYNRGKEENWVERNQRSVQCRLQTIEKAVRKLNGCVRQVENLHPSGASEKDIIAQAKTLLTQDPNFKNGFKFDHVWDMMKDFKKFSDVDFGRTKARKHGSTYVSSEFEAPIPDSPLVSSPNLLSFH